MNLDGFTVSASDVATYARHFQLVTEGVVELMKKGKADPSQADSGAELVN
jgi:hypothetical protein